MTAEQHFKEIMETHGGLVADRAIELLLNDPQLTAIKPFTEFIAKNWRDCFSPTLISLGCQFVGGNPKDTEEIAASISLMNLSFRLWDDIIDETMARTLKPTFVGKFGRNTALIFGGAVSAKAFIVANQVNLESAKKREINELIWNYWATMARSEIKDLNAKADEYHASDKLNKIEAETINIQTCLRIGAIIGNGSATDIELLETYGSNLGIMFELLKDVKVSLNLTLELESKLKSGQLPFLLLLAREGSEKINDEVGFLGKKHSITPDDMSRLIRTILNSDSWARFTKLFQDTSEKCQSSLIDKSNSAAEMLITISRSQSDAFWETIK
jgi:Geranylgeranyl pyrophosphate synthase